MKLIISIGIAITQLFIILSIWGGEICFHQHSYLISSAWFTLAITLINMLSGMQLDLRALRHERS